MPIEPSPVERLLLALLPRQRRDDLAGDLYEEATAIEAHAGRRRARRWLRRQLMAFATKAMSTRVARFRHSLLSRPLSWLSLTDLRIGVRLALRQPVASATAILALAAAIGLSVAGFTLLRTTLFNELPIDGGDRVYQAHLYRDGRRSGPVEPEIRAWLEMSSDTATLGVFQTIRAPIRFGEASPVTVSSARVRPSAFAAISPPPLLGRHLTPADSRPGAEPVVVLSEPLWRTHLGAAADVIGSRIEVSGEMHTLVGILPDGWGFPAQQLAWRPVLEGRDGGFSRGSAVVWVQVPEGSGPEPVAAVMEGLAVGLTLPDDLVPAEIRMVPYTRGFVGADAAPATGMLMALLLALLLVVSLNVANLVLARTAGRADEIAVRTALGAPRGRICAQLFVEVLVLGLTAATIGTAGAGWVLGWVDAQVGADEWPFWVDLGMSPPVVGAALALAVVASAAASFTPALKVTRGLAATLAAGSGRQSQVAMGRVTSLLLAIELAVSLALLAVAALLGQALLVYDRAPVSYDAGRVLTASLYRDPAATDRAPTTEELRGLRLRLERELGEIPGVERAGMAMSLPRVHQNVDPFEVDDPRFSGEVFAAEGGYVTPGFLRAVGVEPLQGRTFEAGDAEPDAPEVAVVSESFVQAHLGGRWAPGLRIREILDRDAYPDRDDYPWLEIVGVVPDLGLDPGDPLVRGEVYRIVSASNFYYVAMRTAGDPLLLADELREAVADADPAIRVSEVLPLSSVGWETRAVLRGGGTALAVLGVMALLLALAGIYALAAMAVSSRTREIGVRMALGASRSSILRTVMARSIRQLLAGAAGGFALALLLARATRVLPFAVPDTIGLPALALAAVMVGAGLLASWAPARRALRIDPMEALRSE